MHRILTQQSLHVINRDLWHPDMMSATQPLAIDGNHVCSDSLLIQKIRYSSIERMQRETAALSIKKDVFSDFEPSITQVPKYCFTVRDTAEALFVHPVPKVTLEHLLEACERIFHGEYLCNPSTYYRQWFKEIRSRYRNDLPAGKTKPLKAIAAFRRFLFPAPPRIPLSQRKRFAARLIHAVLTHHRNSIYHDCITERTVFFRTINQPVLLANYSGVPSPILKHFFPAELSGVDRSVSSYGQHLRDTMCVSLIVCRILTGEPSDPSVKYIDSPRPAVLVLREFCERTGIGKKQGTALLRNCLHTLPRAVRLLTEMTAGLFDPRRYPRWRKLNRATGGLWRAVPFIGPACDILLPTRCASALRSILDRDWFHTVKHLRKNKNDVYGNQELSYLLSTLQTGKPHDISCYQSAFSMLRGDDAKKRHTFDSMMEVSSGHAFPVKKPRFSRPQLITASILLFFSLFPILFLLRTPLTSPPETEPANNPVVSRFIDTGTVSQSTENSPVMKNTDTASAPLLPEGPESPQTKKKERKPVRKKKAVHKKRPPPPPFSPQRETLPDPVVEQPSPPPPPCYLEPASSFGKVYRVTGTCTECNLADVRFIEKETGDTSRLGDDAGYSTRLYVARKSAGGYGPVRTAKQCPETRCSKGVFYEAFGNDRFGIPLTVSPGDLVGYRYLTMHAYVMKQRRSRKK